MRTARLRETCRTPPQPGRRRGLLLLAGTHGKRSEGGSRLRRQAGEGIRLQTQLAVGHRYRELPGRTGILLKAEPDQANRGSKSFLRLCEIQGLYPDDLCQHQLAQQQPGHEEAVRLSGMGGAVQRHRHLQGLIPLLAVHQLRKGSGNQRTGGSKLLDIVVPTNTVPQN